MLVARRLLSAVLPTPIGPSTTINREALPLGLSELTDNRTILQAMSDIRQESVHRSSLWIDRLPGRDGEHLEMPGDEFVFVETKNL